MGYFLRFIGQIRFFQVIYPSLKISKKKEFNTCGLAIDNRYSPDVSMFKKQPGVAKSLANINGSK